MRHSQSTVIIFIFSTRGIFIAFFKVTCCFLIYTRTLQPTHSLRRRKSPRASPTPLQLSSLYRAAYSLTYIHIEMNILLPSFLHVREHFYFLPLQHHFYIPKKRKRREKRKSFIALQFSGDALIKYASVRPLNE